MVETPDIVLGLLISFGIAIGARLLTDRTALPYTVLLVAVSFVFTLPPSQAYVEFALAPLFTHDIILLVFLPAIVFQGAAAVDYAEFRENLPVFGMIVLVGLPVAVTLVGWLGSNLFGTPLLIMLLFGAMAYPIDPVAVISLFERTGAPERLQVLTEGESLLDDSLAIVLFSTLLALVQEASPAELTGTALLSIGRLWTLAVDFLVATLGGVLIGFVNGYLVYRIQRLTDDRLNILLLTLAAAYGSFFVGEEILGVSGVLAAVITGLLLGTHGVDAMSEETITFLQDVWEALVFVMNTILFIAIGLEVSSGQIIGVLRIILLTLLLLLVVRATVVYGITNLLNQLLADPVPVSYQHVIVWGGMHGVVPVALALSLGPSVPYQDRLQTIVFGVVVASMVIQGLFMPKVLQLTGVVESGEPDGSNSHEQSAT